MKNYQDLKMKFTDGNGNYIFKVPVVEMDVEDLKDYKDYLALKYNKANEKDDKFGTCTALKHQQKYCNLLRLIKNNRPDFVLTEKELQVSCF